MDKELLKKRIDDSKQIVVTYETNDDAGIDWDTRSLDDARELLTRGLNYVEREFRYCTPHCHSRTTLNEGGG